MTPEEFSGKLQAMHQRLADLSQAESLGLDATMEELQASLEELRVADEELRQQNEQLTAAHLRVEMEQRRYQELFELAPDAYLVTDLTGIISEANISTSRLLGIPSQYLAGKALAAYVAAEDRTRFRALLSNVGLGQGRGSNTVSLKLQPREGHTVIAELTYSVSLDLDGKPNGRAVAIRDVTQQERMAQQIRSLNAELETRVAERTADLTAAQHLSDELLRREQSARRAAEASEAQSRHVQKLESIGVLAGGIAHDFNNLLHVVLGNADIALSNLAAGSPAREPLEEVVRATLRAADLTRQLLAYSGKGAFVIRHLDLSSEVREMATLLRTGISRQATLEWDLHPDLPAISADPTQIRQIVMNLITNASDALGEAGGTITLRTGVSRPEELSEQSGALLEGDEAAKRADGPWCSSKSATPAAA